VKSGTYRQDSLLIVYDAEQVQHPRADLFDPGYWDKRGCVTGEAVGRGSAWFIDAPFGAAVLRRYLRGGMMARISRDRYLFTGWARSRPVAEFRVLERLAAAGLPVPAPLAAGLRRRGLLYTGGLITRRIPGARPLADLLPDRAQDTGLWRRVGACVRRFHDAGLIHADLNARNILVDAEGSVYLIDFDRARIRRGAERRFRRNLVRLHRSLVKVWPPGQPAGLLASSWTELEHGYRVGRTAETEARRPLRALESKRLTLIAASSDLIAADLAGAGVFADALGADVPSEWPPAFFGGSVMRAAQAQLLNPAERGWSVWYLLDAETTRPAVIGMCQFKGRPDATGSVEIAYAILDRYRARGYATEAVARLIEWAFGHQNVVQVTAETLPHLRNSIRVLEKVGMTSVGAGSEHGVVRYAVRKGSGR
jgi:3-deoxy-D-manno-octulosonic acid kinase